MDSKNQGNNNNNTTSNKMTCKRLNLLRASYHTALTNWEKLLTSNMSEDAYHKAFRTTGSKYADAIPKNYWQ